MVRLSSIFERSIYYPGSVYERSQTKYLNWPLELVSISRYFSYLSGEREQVMADDMFVLVGSIQNLTPNFPKNERCQQVRSASRCGYQAGEGQRLCSRVADS